MTWPHYTEACRRDVDALLKKGGTLSAYRANPKVGVGPAEGSLAWRLEREIEHIFKIKHAIAVNSGTAALHAALASLDLRGGKVITSPYSFSATVSAIILAGGTPVFADVDEFTYNITKETVDEAWQKGTKAVLPVSLFGLPAEVSAIAGLGATVIEDGCQAVGAVREGAYQSPKALATAWSFNGGKNVPAGECGALVTESDEVAQKARYLLNHAENFGQKWVGYNYRPNELTCCVAYHGVKALMGRNTERARLARSLFYAIQREFTYASLRWQDYLHMPPYQHTHGNHAFYVWPFLWYGGTRRLPLGRNTFVQRMKRKGFEIGEGYITPTLNEYPAFKRYCKRKLPVVEQLSKKTLCIWSGVVPGASDDDMGRFATAMVEAVKCK